MPRSLSILCLLVIAISGCERYNDNSVFRLAFSSDTIHFDTIFTSIGSTTRELRVRNTSHSAITVDRLYLGGGNDSYFRLNIDGEPASERQNVRIEGGDSLYIFVDVFIDPASKDSPFIVSDSIMFESGAISQKVYLLAWGQDIILMENSIIGSETWSGSKPFVIYGTCIVDTLHTLVIEEGVQVYFHRQASLVVAGSLTVNGSLESPVLIASDRLEDIYNDIPGQWNGIVFLNTSRGNRISFSEIRNAITGISVGEPYDIAPFPDLKILNTRIFHSSLSGISAMSSSIQVANSIIAHCGSYCTSMQAGGDYTFTHCTFSNWWEYGFRTAPVLSVSETSDYPLLSESQLNLNLGNCVIYGNMKSEVGIVSRSNLVSGNYFFDHCLIKLDTLASSFWTRDRFPGNIVNRDPLFLDDRNLDFRPDTLSPLIDAGNGLYVAEYPFDIRGISREADDNPDIGAFERVPGETGNK